MWSFHDFCAVNMNKQFTPTPQSTVAAVTVSKMADARFNGSSKSGPLYGLSCDFRHQTFLCKTIICDVKCMPNMVEL